MARSIKLLNGMIFRYYPQQLLEVLSQARPNYEWKYFVESDKIFSYQLLSRYSRAGINVWPFENSIVEMANYAMPEYQADFSESFQQVTDHRCHELWQSHGSKPWLLCWSGGIDSTTMLISVLKNLTPDQRRHFAVYCNTSSIWENPTFFLEHIRPNFAVIDSTEWRAERFYQNYTVIDGEPADCLWGIPSIFELEPYADLSWRQQPDFLLQWLTSKAGSRPCAEWFYQQIKSNLDSVNVPVINYRDWFWWMNFNHSWIVSTVRHLNMDVNFAQAQKSHVHWFDSINYQLWSMNNNHNNQKQFGPVENYKRAAKTYIHEFTKNFYDRWFKVKATSNGRRTYDNKVWSAMLDDFSLVRFNDIKTVQDLIPTHLNVC